MLSPASFAQLRRGFHYFGLTGMPFRGFKAPCPLEAYFSQYPPFAYNPNKSPTSEFYRMCKFFGWRQCDTTREARATEKEKARAREREKAHKSFKDALVRKFNSKYGTNANDIASWQLLCNRLGIFPIPNTLKECRQVCSYITHDSSPELSCPTDSDEDSCQFSGPCH